MSDQLVPAYIDPGSGSLIFQAVVAAFMAATVTVKLYWRRLRMLFRRRAND
jgi:hypothetical protein